MERSPTPRVQSPLKSPGSPIPQHDLAGPHRLSFAQRKAQLSRPSKSKLSIVEGNSMMRNIDRPPPGDPMSSRRKSFQPILAKRRSTYYEGEFAGTREVNPVKDQVRGEALVVAELKTNVIINDEFTFITDLSYHLSNRYQRPMSSIVITVQHGSFMMFGGSFDPAYTLTVFALPYAVQPTTNKRNAALIQAHMHETLGVGASRGYVCFVATPEENVARNGRTLAGEMDELDNYGSEEAVNDLTCTKSDKSTKQSKTKRKMSHRSFRQMPSNDEPAPIPTPPSSADEPPVPLITTMIPEHPPSPPIKDQGQPFGGEDKREKTATRRKSFVTTLFSSRRPKAAPSHS